MQARRDKNGTAMAKGRGEMVDDVDSRERCSRSAGKMTCIDTATLKRAALRQ